MSIEYEATAEPVLEADDDLFLGKIPIAEALQRLRLRLLDLTGRNRLLNFKHTIGKALQFVHTNPEAVFSRLYPGSNGSGCQISPVAEPPRTAWVTTNGRLTKPDAKQYANSLGIDTSYELPASNRRAPVAAGSGNQLKTLYYAEDLGKHCRKIEREGRLAIEETGANMLYLVFGFLEYPETSTSDKLYRAPLICLPVKIEKITNGPYTTFSLVYTGEELADNLSLREKVLRDFGLSLPEFDEDGTLADYFDAIEETIEDLPQWRLRRMLSLTLLSFANMLLVRDLDPETWESVGGLSNLLLEHPIVRRVFEGAPHTDAPEYGAEYAIDDHKHVHLPLIYDADSSQHSALIDVIEGKTIVIEGPPGTGKSQTITNLIAAAINSGKKVLFVSEKLAALEVVKARLSQAGLENFVLELHSNKTNKKRVIDDLETRHRFKPRVPAGLDSMLESLEGKRKELKAYVDLLNGVHGNHQDMSVHKILWRAEKFRVRSGEAADLVKAITIDTAPTTTATQFHAFYDVLRYVAKHHDEIGSYDESHPFWGFYPEVVQPGDDLRIQRLLADACAGFDEFAEFMANAAELLGGPKLNMSAASANNLVNVLSSLAPADPSEVAFDLLPKIFHQNDPSGRSTAPIIEDIRSRLSELERLREIVAGRWSHPEPAAADILNTAKSFDALSRVLNTSQSTFSDLKKRVAEVEQSIRLAHQALAQLDSITKLVGLEADAHSSTFSKLELVLAEAERAPDDLLHLRHEGLRHPHATAALEKARTDITNIREQHAALDRELYLDITPSAEDLKAAIIVLREGDAWYRIFQGRWRNALKVHKQLQREKVKTLASARLGDLEEVLDVTRRYQAWQNREDLKNFSGPSFRNDETPLGELIDLSAWIAGVVRKFQQAQIPLAVFDPISVGFERLTLLRAHIPEARPALEQLKRLEATVQKEFPDAPAFNHGNFAVQNWRSRLGETENLLAEAKAHCELLETKLASSLTIGSILAIVQASHRIPVAVQELNEHVAGQSLLGNYFSGTATQLDSVEGALTYGRLIKKANLPSAIEAVLISESSPENHALLSQFIRGIKQGWDAADKFAEEMSCFGHFELGKWVSAVNGNSVSNSEFAAKLATKTRQAHENLDGLQSWSQYVAQRKEAISQNRGAFITLLESQRVASRRLSDAFAYRFYASIAESLFRAYPQLSRFNGLRHSTVRAEFAELDKEIIRLRGQQIAAKCVASARPPAGMHGARVSDKTEMTLLEHLMSLQLPRTPVRQILKRAGRAVQELKPCFMMGPQAVAQFLEPGQLQFDIVVMDEASQLKPEEAIGAIARGKQLVVVGDPKQLPPTSFFSRQNQPADGDGAGQQTATEDAESILDVCIGHFQPVRTLRWHYRSRHESLIAFSNHYFYDGELFVFPSPYPQGKSLGLHYNYVADGVYDSQMNKVEALRVVDAIVEHVCTRPDDSLGVVTLNIKQRDLIAELWEERRKSLPQADDFEQSWDAKGMGLFFKNLENVQGDERDCIIISTTFGKVLNTKVVRQNFGPISRQGGWRRLNVLFTRARKSVGLFTSMQPEDIVVDESTPRGTQALRNYLEYARSGILPQQTTTGLDPDSDFEVSVIELIESWGYSVTPQLGVAGFRIDIAVNHPDYPGAYLAAVECDGATYHSGVSVRDRDRIRQEILESLGWKDRIWRIWSTDWFRNPLVEAKKLFSFLQSLKGQPIPSEFIVEPRDTWEETAAPSNLPTALVQQEVEDIGLFDAEDEDLEIEIGDLVSYCMADNANAEPTMVRITAGSSDFEHGLIAAHTPLAQALIGATVGDTVALRVPGQLVKQFVIKAIKRSHEGVGA